MKNKFLYLTIVSILSASIVSAQSLKEAADRQNNKVVSTPTSQQFVVKGVPFDMILVKGGTFSMGAGAEQSYCDRDEKPVHSVSLSTFYIGSTEVTQELWKIVMGTSIEQQRDKANPAWPLRGVGDSYPMYYVSYDEIQDFLLRLNELTGKNFALPTEAQWEYAARGGNKSAKKQFSGDDYLDNVGWYAGNASNSVHPVAQKTPNELDIFDMSGNLWEWCSDWYSIDSYKKSVGSNPQGVDSGEDIVLRGGCIITDENSCRVSNRGHMSSNLRNSFTGFRLVLIP